MGLTAGAIRPGEGQGAGGGLEGGFVNCLRILSSPLGMCLKVLEVPVEEDPGASMPIPFCEWEGRGMGGRGMRRPP